MGLNVSDRTLSECVNLFINSIDIEKVNIKYLLVEAGLSKEATKEILNILVDRFSENPDKPIARIDMQKATEDNFKESLVKEYNLTYTIANNLISMYKIVRPEQLSYLSDEELLQVTGIGNHTLVKIRAKFPYVSKPEVESVINISITELCLPTKAEETLRENNVLYIQQVEDFIDNELQNVGYPICTLIEEGYKAYQSGTRSEHCLTSKYLELLINSFSRNLNNIVRHSSEKLNLYWIDQSNYLIITYLYELMNKHEYYDCLVSAWSELKKSREQVLTEYGCNAMPADNSTIISQYSRLQDSYINIITAISNL